MIPGGSESLVYATVTGTIGVLVPFTAHEEQDFFQHLEMHMRSENPPLCGRDHLSYRSYYFPVKVNKIKCVMLRYFNLFCLFRMFVMVTCVNSITLLMLQSRKVLLLISTKHLLKYLNDLKTLERDMHFKNKKFPNVCIIFIYKKLYVNNYIFLLS